MEELINFFLAKRLNKKEQEKLDIWLDEDPGNKRTLSKLSGFMNYNQNEVNEASYRVRNKLLKQIQNERISTGAKVQKNKYSVVSKVAAAVVLMVGVSLLAMMLNFSTSIDGDMAFVNYNEKVTLAGEKITTRLPDGTIIKMNSESQLIVPDKFEDHVRVVTLKGEAFFDVARDESRPFIIKTEKFDIQVLGTSFNVNAYQNEDNSVAVKTGKVQVSNTLSEDDQVVLVPNQKVSVSTDGKSLKFSQISDPDKEFGWVDQKLIFNNVTKEEVFKRLERWYGVDVKQTELSKIQSNKRYTAKYQNPSFEKVMTVLSHVYGFEYQVVDNKLIIKE